MDNLPSLKLLLRYLQQVPYLASKNLYKVALYFLNSDDKKIEQFCSAIIEAKKKIVKCEMCFTFKEKNSQCIFCDTSKRNQSVICVVETWQELIAIENTGGYTGVYHVLGGSICPLEGIGPENLTIEQLINRTRNNHISEIIFAMNQTPEGEATTAYIAQKLKNNSIKISCLAKGVPVGSVLEYMDRVTLYKALSERRPF